MSYAEIGKQLSTLADAYDVKLPRELVLIGKQFLYVERYMKLLAPEVADDERSAAHRVLRQLHGGGQPRTQGRRRVGGLTAWRSARGTAQVRAIWTSSTRIWATQTTRPSC